MDLPLVPDLAEVLPGRVAVVCGGGSGHEPAFAGYVGDGMLDASIAGSVFASPPATQILAAILGLAEHRPSGILVVVFNYTGDRSARLNVLGSDLSGPRWWHSGQNLIAYYWHLKSTPMVVPK